MTVKTTTELTQTEITTTFDLYISIRCGYELSLAEAKKLWHAEDIDNTHCRKLWSEVVNSF